MANIFVGYPSSPSIISDSIEPLPRLLQNHSVTLWEFDFSPGSSIPQEVRSAINEADICLFDISTPNFNVYYEAAYSIGRGKPTIPLICSALKDGGNYLKDIGIFDTIINEKYYNSETLAQIAEGSIDRRPIYEDIYSISTSQPVYLLNTLHKIDFSKKVVAALKHSSAYYRSFDPEEEYRLNALECIREVASSLGVLTTYLPNELADSEYHNLRCAFISGLSDGMDRRTLIMRYTKGETPLDLRDDIKVITGLSRIPPLVDDFARDVLAGLQSVAHGRGRKQVGLIKKISLGASAAENEFLDLSDYFVETHEFQEALAGRGRIVVGRKGTGKTAIFWQVRDRIRAHSRNFVIDLKPDGYQFRKFKESIFTDLSVATKEHTLSAFWEYVLWCELAYKITEQARHEVGRIPGAAELIEPVRTSLDASEYESEGDFSERLSRLVNKIVGSLQHSSKDDRKHLTAEDVTRIIHSRNIREVRESVLEYMRLKDDVLVLVDNLDKGLEPSGITLEDTLFLRTLLEALRKVERHAVKKRLDFHSLIFIRNDVYLKVIESTPDRGKEGLILVDWSDREILARVIYERIESSAKLDENGEETWAKVSENSVGDQKSMDFLLDRCLMRPRALIELTRSCLGRAISAGHERIEHSDFMEGYRTYSQNQLNNVDLEIQDIEPDMYESVFALMGMHEIITKSDIESRLKEFDFDFLNCNRVIAIWLAFSVLGIIDRHGNAKYIYDVNYDGRILEKNRKSPGSNTEKFCINPAFHAALEIDTGFI